MKRVTVAVTALLALTGCSESGPFDSRSHLGQTPPALGGTGEHWLNARTPLSLESLRGRAVWLQFSFLG